MVEQQQQQQQPKTKTKTKTTKPKPKPKTETKTTTRNRNREVERLLLARKDMCYTFAAIHQQNCGVSSGNSLHCRKNVVGAATNRRLKQRRLWNQIWQDECSNQNGFSTRKATWLALDWNCSIMIFGSNPTVDFELIGNSFEMVCQNVGSFYGWVCILWHSSKLEYQMYHSCIKPSTAAWLKTDHHRFFCCAKKKSP